MAKRNKKVAFKLPKQFYGWWSDKLSKKVPIIHGTNLNGDPVDAVAMTSDASSAKKVQKQLKECFNLTCNDLVPLGQFLPPGYKP